MNKKKNFLHNHPGKEKAIGLDLNHVIVDRLDWDEFQKAILNTPSPSVYGFFDKLKLPTINAKYYIATDTYDSDALTYILARDTWNTTEVLIQRRVPEKIEFYHEVELLAKIFNATILETKK